MADEDTSYPAKALAQPRTSQACKRCRSLKARCLTSGRQGICQRCLNSNRECIWPETQQRSRMPRGPSRISQVEKKIDGLVARIASTPSSEQVQSGEKSKSIPTATTESHQDDDHEYATPISIPDHFSERCGDDVRPAGSMQELADMHDFDAMLHETQTGICPAKIHKVPVMGDELSQNLLVGRDAEHLLEQYRLMTPSFPFVTISPKATAPDMNKRKPMLLLAVMAVASWHDRKQQALLEKQYRQELANRLYIEPRKNLVLLQSILVYLAWYHFFVDPKFGSEVLLTTLIGLTAELKLDPQSMPRILPGRDPRKRIRYGTDGQRTLLGCYYLCSINANGLRVRPFFHLSRHMLESVQQLEQNPELDSDRDLAYLIRTRHFEDQVNDFLYPSGLHVTRPSCDQVLSQLITWQTCISAWKENVSFDENPIILRFSYFAIEMELYNSVFRHLNNSTPTSQHTMSESTKIDLLWLCIEAGRSYLDALVSTSLEDYHLLPYTVWQPLPRILIVMAMFTAPSEHHLPQWNIKTARDRVRLDLFLESLCFRMQSLSKFKSMETSQPDFFIVMKMVLQSVRKWYKRMLSRGNVNLTPASEKSTSLPSNVWQMNGDPSPNQLFHAQSALPESNGGFTFTPDSASNATFAGPDVFTQLQSSLQPIMCPMMGMGKNVDFDLDQFMDVGFWGNDFNDFDMTGFDFSTS